MSTLSLVDLCRQGNLEDVWRALTSGEDVNKVDRNYGCSGLMVAVENQHNSIVELLLSQPDLDVNLVANNWHGWTALHYACYARNLEGLKMLLAHPRMNSHNVKDRNGRTPLMAPINNRSVDCIKLLLKVDRVDLDTGSLKISVEVGRLIDEEKNRRKKVAEEKEEKEKKEQEEEEERKREEEALHSWKKCFCLREPVF